MIDNPNFQLGIIRETRLDERRTPLIPEHINKIKKLYKNIKVVIQPSENRCFNNDEYKNAGAEIDENLNDCNLILGVKEIGNEYLIEDKTYLFFSHTSKIQSDNSAAAQGTPGMDKKELLKTILKKKITLIDYENIRNNNGARYLGFGRFAGIVGCYNSLALYENFINNLKMKRAFELGTYDILKDSLVNKKFSKIKILITGDGRVNRGVLEMLSHTNICEISKEDYLSKDYNTPVFCNLKTADYVTSDSKKNFDLQHFIDYPEKYRSNTNKFLIKTNLLISAHYWDPSSPKIFELKDLKDYSNLKVIGDITCDINGSIPTTLKSTSIEDPYFYYDINNFTECDLSFDALAIMAVDNLPSELPRNSSAEFGEGVLNEVLPYIIGKDDKRINDATITKNGFFQPKYSYLENYIKT